uniref:Tea4 n=1 Tax=Ganoderma boninense TaxID=34458 RepID=A0A5K1K426_9APHY|nr:Tea4 [Ganoderma boninense]
MAGLGDLLYEAPSFVHLLVVDYLFYGGLVAEIALGTVYGSPLANILPVDWQTTFTTVGYLGLILVVFEGGLSTNLPVLLSNLPLSIVCALTGIAAPIALSFALLQAGFGYEPLEAFAAGAALSSTSLGTTLAALNSVTKYTATLSVSDPSLLDNTAHTISENANSATQTFPQEKETPLQQSRICTILISAAIIDDVVGLVIASLIPALATVDSNYPYDNSSNLAWIIIRPLLSSFLIAVIAPFVSRFVLRPIFLYQGLGERWCAPAREGKPWGAFAFSKESSAWGTSEHSDAMKLFIMVITLSGMAAIANYTDTSVLYGAYVAGLILTYISQPPPREDSKTTNELSFEQTFGRSIGSLQTYIFLPLFFASIGFAIPFLDLWKPTILWRGIVYSVLMAFAKLAVGIPILLYPVALSFVHMARKKLRKPFSQLGAEISQFLHPMIPPLIGCSLPSSMPRSSSPIDHARPDDDTAHNRADSPQCPPVPTHQKSTFGGLTASIPAAVFMGTAMVSRGEIGLLIAQLARGNNSSGEKGLLGDEAFLVCIWAILLCTLVGPIGTGIVVRRWGPRVAAGLWA